MNAGSSSKNATECGIRALAHSFVSCPRKGVAFSRSISHALPGSLRTPIGISRSNGFSMSKSAKGMAWILALLLLGCEQATPDVITLTRIYAKDEAELRRYCGDDLIIEPLGCQRGGKMTGSSRCTVYLLKPRGFDDHRRVETLGHEVLHCFDGRTHT